MKDSTKIIISLLTAISVVGLVYLTKPTTSTPEITLPPEEPEVYVLKIVERYDELEDLPMKNMKLGESRTLRAPKVETPPISQEVDTKISEQVLGDFILTAYCSCEQCCGIWATNRPVDEYGNEIIYGASGNRLSSNYSVAVDPTVIPYGTEIIIDGNTYVAHDCGGAIKGNRIDVYFDNHEEALKFGRQEKTVYLADVNS